MSQILKLPKKPVKVEVKAPAPVARPVAKKPSAPRSNAPKPNTPRREAPRYEKPAVPKHIAAPKPAPPKSSSPPHENPEDPRLSKRMSELGLCSRREADEWIENGWVNVDGTVVKTLG